MLADWIDRLITRYHGRGLILDASPLLLLLVGRYDSRLLKPGRRTAPCTVDHFEILQQIQLRLGHTATTPSVVTEALHHAEEFGIGVMEEASLTLAPLAEVYEPSLSLARETRFPDLGLADASVLQLAREQRGLVATDDKRLRAALYSIGVESVAPAEFFSD